jgi:YVTN family beta-propeller protein
MGMKPRALVVLLVAILGGGCGSGTEPGDVVSLSITPPSMSLLVGDSAPIAVAALNARGQSIAGTPVGLASSDTAIVVITVSGKVRAVTYGSAGVIVNAGGLTDTVPVYVTVTTAPVPGEIRVTPTTRQLALNDSLQLQATVWSSTGEPMAGAVSFASLDPAVATVTSSGLVRPVTAGTMWVLATSGDLTTRVEVTVLDRLLTGVYLSDVTAGGAMGYATAYNAAALLRFDLAARRRLGDVATGSRPIDVTLDPPGTTVYVANENSGTISVFDVASGSALAPIPVPGNPRGVRVGGGGSKLFVIASGLVLYRLDVPSSTVEDSLSVPNGYAIEFNAGRTLLYVAQYGSIREVDPATMAIARTFAAGYPRALAITSDNSELWVADLFGGIQVWDLASGTLDTVLIPQVRMDGLAMTQGDVRVIATSWPGTVFILDRVARRVVESRVVGGGMPYVAVDPQTGIALVANSAGWVDFIP